MNLNKLNIYYQTDKKKGDNSQWRDTHKSIKCWQGSVLLPTATSKLGLFSVGDLMKSSVIRYNQYLRREEEEEEGTSLLLKLIKSGTFQLIALNSSAQTRFHCFILTGKHHKKTNKQMINNVCGNDSLAVCCCWTISLLLNDRLNHCEMNRNEWKGRNCESLVNCCCVQDVHQQITERDAVNCAVEMKASSLMEQESKKDRQTDRQRERKKKTSLMNRNFDSFWPVKPKLWQFWLF